MNHPSHEDWIAYAYAELPPARHAELHNHHASCAECRAVLGSLEETLATLDAWEIPAASPRPPLQTISRFASAAALLATGLWIGFAVTRWTTLANLDPTASHQALRAEVVSTVARQFRAQAEPAPEHRSAASEHPAASRAVSHSTDDHLRAELLLRLAALEHRQRQDTAALRQDLETVAFLSETEFGRTQRQLGELASFTR